MESKDSSKVLHLGDSVKHGHSPPNSHSRAPNFASNQNKNSKLHGFQFTNNKFNKFNSDQPYDLNLIRHGAQIYLR